MSRELRSVLQVARHSAQGSAADALSSAGDRTLRVGPRGHRFGGESAHGLSEDVVDGRGRDARAATAERGGRRAALPARSAAQGRVRCANFAPQGPAAARGNAQSAAGIAQAKSLPRGPAEGAERRARDASASWKAAWPIRPPPRSRRHRKRRAQERIEAARRNKQMILLASIAACAVLASFGSALPFHPVAERGPSGSSPPRTHEKSVARSAELRQRKQGRIRMPILLEKASRAAPRPRGPRLPPGKIPLPARRAPAGRRGDSRHRQPSAPESPVAAEPLLGTSEMKPSAAEVAVARQSAAADTPRRNPRRARPTRPRLFRPATRWPVSARCSILPPLAKTKSGKETGPATLGPLPLVDLKDARFTVLGADEVFGHAVKATVAAVDEAKPGRWRVELRERDGDPQVLAEFRLARRPTAILLGAERRIPRVPTS